jgi:nucleotide-binding universal stress UspA family protein
MTQTSNKPFHRIVVGLDGSEFSEATLKWAAAQAELTGSTLEVLTTWQSPISYGWVMPIPEGFDPRAAAGEAIASVLKVVHDLHPALVIHSHVVEGHPAPTLVEASGEADLLVVGGKGHGDFAGLLLGAVSDYCAHHAKCPIVIIH